MAYLWMETLGLLSFTVGLLLSCIVTRQGIRFNLRVTRSAAMSFPLAIC
jgi:hypothetical protein